MLLTDKYDEISEYSLNISDYDRKFCVENLKIANLLTVAYRFSNLERAQQTRDQQF
jgi:hypothetical protein